MTLFQNVLRLFAFVVFAVATTHFLLGPNAEILLGSGVSKAAITDPVLDSQNRFYGTCFALFGVVLWLAARNIEKYQVVFNWLLLIFLAGGVSRLVSIALVGVPSIWVLGLLATELIFPPVLFFWLSSLRRVNQ